MTSKRRTYLEGPEPGNEYPVYKIYTGPYKREYCHLEVKVNVVSLKPAKGPWVIMAGNTPVGVVHSKKRILDKLYECAEKVAWRFGGELRDNSCRTRESELVKK